MSFVRFSLRDLLPPPPPKNISKMSIARKRGDGAHDEEIEVTEGGEGESEGMKIHTKTHRYVSLYN